MRLKLSDGNRYGFDGEGRRVCLGARLGRADTLPEDRELAVKLHLERLKWVDGDYDQEGAYWGRSGSDVWCAWFRLPSFEKNQIEIFVRAKSRAVAKSLVWEYLPYATFYR